MLNVEFAGFYSSFFKLFTPFKAFYQRADTKLQRTDIADIIYLQERERLVVALHDVTNLVLDKAVRTATEAGHLYEMYLVALFGCPLCSLHECGSYTPIA